MSLKKSILKNGIASGLQKIVIALNQLLLVPFFITSWGAAYYGEWLTLTIIPSVLAFSDLGLGSAAANSFVLKYASGDKKAAADIAKSGYLLISGVVVFGFFLSITILYVLFHYDFLEKLIIKKEDAIWSVSALIVARLIGFYNQFFEAYFRAARRASLSINLITFNNLLNIAVGAAILVAGYGVVAFAFSQLTVSLLFVIFYRITAKKVLGLSKIFEGIANKADMKFISAKGFGYLMSPMWQAIYFQGTTFVVRLTLGAEAVAIFNTTRTLCRSINQIFSMVNGAIFPELQYEIGAGNMKKAQRIYVSSILGVLILALVGITILWVLGPWFYKIWTKNQLQIPNELWSIFVVGIFFNALWWTAGVVFRAFNRPYELSIVGLIVSVISVLFSYLFSINFGLLGAAMGSVILDILMVVLILPKSMSLLNVKILEMEKLINEIIDALKKNYINYMSIKK